MEMWEDPDKRIEGNLTVGARRALDKATRMLDHNKIAVNQMKTKIVEERFGKVKDIISEGVNGLYDAMVLGRRATYALQWLFDRPADEIPQALVKDASFSSPLWICSEPEVGRKNVLLCVDGSKSALRTADHVGYILNYAKHHNVTVFHVNTGQSGDSETIFKGVLDILISHNIERERIVCKSTWGISIAGTILNEKNSGKYAAVAVGMVGLPNRKLGSFGLQGSTTASLIRKIEKASLWCCP